MPFNRRSLSNLRAFVAEGQGAALSGQLSPCSHLCRSRCVPRRLHVTSRSSSHTPCGLWLHRHNLRNPLPHALLHVLLQSHAQTPSQVSVEAQSRNLNISLLLLTPGTLMCGYYHACWRKTPQEQSGAQLGLTSSAWTRSSSSGFTDHQCGPFIP